MNHNYSNNPFLVDLDDDNDDTFHTFEDGNDEEDDLIERGAAPSPGGGVGSGATATYYFEEEELAAAHAEEQAAGLSSETNTSTSTSYYRDETDTIDSAPQQLQQQALHIPPPLVNYPIFAGEGDIGEIPTKHNAKTPPRRNISTNNSNNKPGIVTRETSQTTSMIPPAEYAAVIGSTRRARQGRFAGLSTTMCPTTRPGRLRCAGAVLSAAGVFVLGFMIVLVGHMWYEKNHPNSSDNAGDEVTEWTVVQVVTRSPAATLAPEAINNRTDDDNGEDDDDQGVSADDKSTNSTTSSSSSDTSSGPASSWMDDESLPQLFQLHRAANPVELSLGAGQAVHIVNNNDTATTLCTDATSRLVTAAAWLAGASARIRQLAVQIDLEQDTTLAVCQTDTDEVEALLHYILVPNNSTNTTILHKEEEEVCEGFVM